MHATIHDHDHTRHIPQCGVSVWYRFLRTSRKPSLGIAVPKQLWTSCALGMRVARRLSLLLSNQIDEFVACYGVGRHAIAFAA